MNKKKKAFFKELIQSIGTHAQDPRCPHFGKCGGCMMQNIAYEDQLNIKKEYLNSILGNIVSVKEVRGIEPYDYRNRMDMVTAFGKLGLREAGNYRFVTDCTTCEIMQEKSRALLKKIRPLMQEIEDYNYLRHKGYNRYVVFRQAYYTGQTMVNFVTAEKENRLQKVIDVIIDEVDSCSLLHHDGKADLSFGPVFETVKGGAIYENFDGIEYRTTPNSFFQSNSQVALQMYQKIKEQVKGRVLDLYSGLGSISLFVADKAESVTGVENMQEAVDMAAENASHNNITNTKFICADSRVFLRETPSPCNTLILDPPRSGMHPKILKSINELAPEKIIYMSCNPAAFAQEAEAFTGYRLESFEAYDMFPQTPHVETLALFIRQK